MKYPMASKGFKGIVLMRKFLIIVALLLGSFCSFADDIPSKPQEPRLVNDLAGIFSQREVQTLEQKLVNFFAQTSNQVSVVTVPSLNGYEIADFAARLGESWGIGKAEYNNGVLILIKPKTGSEKGQVNITVGYGLEGAIPDATASQIISKEMLPQFQNGDMFGGVDSAVDVICDLAQGEYSYQQYAQQSGDGAVPFVFFILFCIVLPILLGGRRRRAFSVGNKRSSLPFWIALGLLNSSRHSHGGMFDDFSSGSGSFGGGSNFGSFGGFGGGSFGGGGASGSW